MASLAALLRRLTMAAGLTSLGALGVVDLDGPDCEDETESGEADGDDNADLQGARSASVLALLDRLAEDGSATCDVLAGLLTRVLPGLPQLSRVELVTSWAISADPARRFAVARSMAVPRMLTLGEAAVIQRLLTDESPEVRQAIADSLARRTTRT